MTIVDRDSTDGDSGIFADVRVLPDGNEETVIVGAAYSFDGGGLYALPQPGEMVLLAAVEGDPDFGLVIIAQVPMAPDIPPEEADAGDGEPSPDLILIARKNARVRIISDGAEVFIEARNSTVRVEADTVIVKADDIQLGEGATKRVARLGDEVRINVPIGAFKDTNPVSGGDTSPLVIVPLTGTIIEGSATVKAVD